MKYLAYLSTPTKEKFDETIEEILSKIEYRHLSQQYTDIMEKFKEKIISWVESMLEMMNFGSEEITSTAPNISNGIIVIGSILIILIIILIILFMKKMVRKDKKVRKILGEIIDERTTTEGLYEKARKYKDLKEYREALRYSFIALLFQMNESNLLYLDETQTNSEIVSTLRKNNFKDVALFEGAAGLFNKVWYGHKTLNEDTYESWEKMIAVLNNEVSNIDSKK